MEEERLKAVAVYDTWSTTGNGGRGVLSCFNGALCIDIHTTIGEGGGGAGDGSISQSHSAQMLTIPMRKR